MKFRFSLEGERWRPIERAEGFFVSSALRVAKAGRKGHPDEACLSPVEDRDGERVAFIGKEHDLTSVRQLFVQAFPKLVEARKPATAERKHVAICGKAKTLSSPQIADILERLRTGESVNEVAKHYNIQNTYIRALKERHNAWSLAA